MASRSHPPTLLKLTERAIRDHALFGRGDLVLCAVSGGPDSMCLLHALALLRKRIGHAVVAVGVDHGLRAEARDELALARGVCASSGVDFHVASVAVERGSNLQERARLARHRALQDRAAALGAAAIALGHTADDRAETLIMRLLRGAGPRGLAVMPPASPGVGGEVRLCRPLIGARRRDIAAHILRHHLPHAADPSNLDRRFMRVRVRNELMPLLEDLAPGIVPHLCALADMLGTGADDVLAPLGRAQRTALEQVLREGLRGKPQAVTLRLQDNRELSVRFTRARKGRPAT